MVQLFTAWPSTCTVHAPHWLVSQPTWVPVRLKSSLNSSTRSRRGSTSTSLCSPLTSRATCRSVTGTTSFPVRSGWRRWEWRGSACGRCDPARREPRWWHRRREDATGYRAGCGWLLVGRARGGRAGGGGGRLTHTVHQQHPPGRLTHTVHQQRRPTPARWRIGSFMALAPQPVARSDSPRESRQGRAAGKSGGHVGDHLQQSPG